MQTSQIPCRNKYSIGWLAQKVSECGTWNVECKIFWSAGFWNVTFGMWNVTCGIWFLELAFCVGQDSITRVTTLYYGLPQGFLSCHWIWKYVFKPADMFSQYYYPLVIKFSYTKSHFTLKILLKKDIKSSRNSIGWLAQKTSECGTWNVECGTWNVRFFNTECEK